MMEIKSLWNKLFSGTQKTDHYDWEVHHKEGLIFRVNPSVTAQITKGEADLYVTHQHITLGMLAEQGDAEAISNGFIVPTEVALHLDSLTQEILELPPQWDGRIKADIQGATGRSSFTVNLKTSTEGSSYTGVYTIEGPIFQKKYLLSPAQHLIFSALKTHRSSDHSEYDNLRLMLSLQEAQKAGAKLDLSHFDQKKLQLKSPESISVKAELDEHGNLILTPYMGQEASHERIQKVLGQLKSKYATALRVDNEIVLLDKKRLKAVHEILKNRVVPKSRIKEFYKTPTAFIDASLVNLDIGFSTRVHGATLFKHAYFGETEESGIDWFGTSASTVSILPPSKLSSVIKEADQLKNFQSQWDDAKKTGAEELIFEEKLFDISDANQVSRSLDKIKQSISEGRAFEDFDGEGSGKKETQEVEEKKDAENLVVDLDLNDEQLDVFSQTLEKSIAQTLYSEKLDWSNYARTPFSHQETGIRWILGLFEKSSFHGGLLADDMGLGKTMMALSAVDHLYKLQEERNQIKKPCLVVAPLSVLQNWKDEVEKTFSISPFKDVVILQSQSDLSRFKDLREVKNLNDSGEDQIASIRFTLKVGKEYLADRLDMPQRLVITTYQSLRDHQFSLCTVDWGMVIFDEAQNIKNPNAMQTRAAKGLKADFRLLATGTPVENSLADFWCIMDTACPGLLESYQEFRQNYILPVIRASGDENEKVRAQTGRELREKVGSFMLRRIKEDHIEGLPEKDIFVGIDEDRNWSYQAYLKTEMKGTQLSLYNATLTAQGDSDSNIVLSALQRLRDISLHPQLADQGTLQVSEQEKELKKLINESGKMQSMLLTLNAIKERGEKCIIFAVNKRLQGFLSLALLKLYGLEKLSIINGDSRTFSKRASVPTRKTMIQDFEAREGFNIIIMSPVAAGVGLTVIGANNVIHLERHWNPAKEAQATDRVYRIGQKKRVNVFIPILHHPEYESFDVNLHYLLSKKTLLKDVVVTPEQIVPNPEGFSGTTMTAEHQIKAEDLHRLSWQHFEALCAELFLKELDTPDCWLTQNGSDYGADIVLSSQSSAKLIQCKHTKNARYDGYKAILEVYGAKLKYSEALNKNVESLLLVTNARKLSVKTKTIAEQHKVQVFAYEELSKLLETHTITLEMILKRLGKRRLKVG